MATQKEVAEFLNISTRMVRKYMQSAVFPEPEKGEGLDLRECVLAYIDYNKVGAKDDTALVKRDDLEKQLLEEKIKEQQLKNGLQAGELVNFAQVIQAMAGCFIHCKTRLRTIKAKYKARNPKATKAELKLLDELIVEACNELADDKFETAAGSVGS